MLARHTNWKVMKMETGMGVRKVAEDWGTKRIIWVVLLRDGAGVARLPWGGETWVVN